MNWEERKQHLSSPHIPFEKKREVEEGIRRGRDKGREEGRVKERLQVTVRRNS
jgi:flagellar biosynthesis/type III secretory pathway protein FliH